MSNLLAIHIIVGQVFRYVDIQLTDTRTRSLYVNVSDVYTARTGFSAKGNLGHFAEVDALSCQIDAFLTITAKPWSPATILTRYPDTSVHYTKYNS